MKIEEVKSINLTRRNEDLGGHSYLRLRLTSFRKRIMNHDWRVVQMTSLYSRCVALFSRVAASEYYTRPNWLARAILPRGILNNSIKTKAGAVRAIHSHVE
jgi:hypothetical protein